MGRVGKEPMVTQLANNPREVEEKLFFETRSREVEGHLFFETPSRGPLSKNVIDSGPRQGLARHSLRR